MSITAPIRHHYQIVSRISAAFPSQRPFVSVAVIITILLIAIQHQTYADEGPELLREFCMDCHSSDAAEGDFVLDLDGSSEISHETLHEFETVYQLVSKEIMPPSDADAPSAKQRKRMLQWLDQKLVSESPLGGMTLRRLNSREYANSIREVFGFSSFELPYGFPPDSEHDGFDNQGDALVMAASHLEAFSETANQIADKLFPPHREPTTSRTVIVPANDMVVSYSSAMLVDGAMRLASSGKNAVRHSTWPSKFESPESGVYEVEVKAHSFVPLGVSVKTPVLQADTTGMSGDAEKTWVGEFESGKSLTKRFEIGLDKGATVQFRYPNGLYDYDDKAEFREFLSTLFHNDRQLALAWKSVGSPARGGSGWDQVKAAMEKAGEDISDLTSDEIDKLVATAAKKGVNTGETLVYKYFEEGPYLAIESVKIRGPIRVYADKETTREIRERHAFLGDDFDPQNEAAVRGFFEKLLSRLFRRPVTEEELNTYTNLMREETSSTGDASRGMHLAVRTALISPAFLYRAVGSGRVNEYELASRLSFFLTSRPPDSTLERLARSGRLSDPEILRQQTQRLIKSSKQRLSTDFTTAWLGLEAVDRLMPDNRLIRKFTLDHRQGMKDEVSASFDHVLQNNLSTRELISPSYVFTNSVVGRDIYQFEKGIKPNKQAKKTRNKGVQQYTVDPKGWRGGLLTMPAVMMATANGVDTQPVLRGVWVLNNLLGTPPPEPPKAVPALTPDTAGASSPKARLAAHMAEESCAGCHREIDPVGFVLESFDAVGRWRDKYPKKTGQKKAVNVDTAGRLPDGTKLDDVTDLKHYLAENSQIFANCVAKKMMTYATGRTMNYRERKMIEQVVASQRDSDYRLQDLVEALITSDVFLTK